MKKWYKTLDELRNECGECDYLYYSCPTHVVEYVGGEVFLESNVDYIMTPEIMEKEEQGYSYFPDIDEYILDAECENGIFVPEKILEERK